MASAEWNAQRAKRLALCFVCEREIGVKERRYGTKGLTPDMIPKITPHHDQHGQRCKGSGLSVPQAAVMDR